MPFPFPEAVGVWGRKAVARRGIAAAKLFNLPLVTIEDAFLRSILPGRTEPPSGLLIDEVGVHFDPSAPSLIENLLNDASNFSPEILAEAELGVSSLIRNGLSKYNLVPRGTGILPEPGFVLVVDQVRGDAAVNHGAAGKADFAKMLTAALTEHPELPVFVKRHIAGRNMGYFNDITQSERLGFIVDDLNPWDILERAAHVYCVSSQLGFEAILAGHRPRVFGAAFYAGWGLTDDEIPMARRKRTATKLELFVAAMLLAPSWYDPILARKIGFTQAKDSLLVRADAHWNGQVPIVVTGVSKWKHRAIISFWRRAKFVAIPATVVTLAKTEKAAVGVWASREPKELARLCREQDLPLLRIEDGFLRSIGLGAELQAPASLVFDRTGIYFDASCASDLENLIQVSVTLAPNDLERSRNLRARIVSLDISKYNVGRQFEPPTVINKRRILVAGQVEGDASIRFACDKIRTNGDLLQAVRQANPEAYVIYKPHPDVLAGLRLGHLTKQQSAAADLVMKDISAQSAINFVDEVWTMTSLLGFEALIRGKKVVTFGMPFYAGWGLTEDRGMSCARRSARPSLDGLVHAALIGYPRYIDPKSGIFATPEQIVEVLARPRRLEFRFYAAVIAIQKVGLRLGLWRRRPSPPF